ncbi:MAG: hypothetical protein WDM70_01980 [Nitrosomonadales bacterium]
MMGKKLITLLFCSQALSAMSMPNDGITLRLDDAISPRNTAWEQHLPSTLISPVPSSILLVKEENISLSLPLSNKIINKQYDIKHFTLKFANVLATKNSSRKTDAKLLRNEQGSIKLKLTKVFASPAILLPTTLQVVPSPLTAKSASTLPTSQQVQSLSPTINKEWNRTLHRLNANPEAANEIKPNLNIELHNRLFSILGLGLLILTLWIELDYYSQAIAVFRIRSKNIKKDYKTKSYDQFSPEMVAYPPIAKSNSPIPSSFVSSLEVTASSDLRDEVLKSFIPQKVEEPVPNHKHTKPYAIHVRSSRLLEVSEEKIESKSPFLSIKNFLADFDPGEDGSVTDFLESRNAVTPEQIIGWSKHLTANRNVSLRLVGV